jgi:hypothetical protein
MLSFFVQLINTIGLPVILVGTYKAWSVLNSEFRQIRRGTGQGDLVWDAMKEDETWEVFVKSLWRYQYVRKPCPLTPELSHALYYESQGITDFAVKLYMLAQVRAIATGKEIITTSIIQSVAKDSLRTARQVLNALKHKDTQTKINLLMDCDDITPIDIEPFIEEMMSSDGRISHNEISSTQSNIIDSEINETHKFNSEKKSNIHELETSRKQKNSINTSTITNSDDAKINYRKRKLKDNLAEIVEKEALKGISAYEALKKAGYIKSPTEYQL